MSVGRQPSAAPAAPAAPAAWRGARRVPGAVGAVGAAGAPRIPAPPRGRLPLALPSLLPLIVVLLVLLAPERSWSGPTGVALLCSRVAGLSARQRAMCRASPDAMVAIGTGLRLALQECQHQFRYERWNCSSGPHPGHHHSLPLVVRVASREAAFSLAVQAAAVSWATAAACARGELSGCSCAKRAPGQHHPGHGLGHGVGHGPGPAAVDPASSGAAVAFRWGGCSSDVEYGAKLSRTFTDAAHHGDGPGNAAMASRLLMDSHNSKAGRKAVKLTLQTDCKCHGVSGSCSIRTCWTSLAPFRAVGDHLMARYRAAWPAVALPLPQGPGPAGAAGAAGARSRRHPVGLRLALRSGRNSRAPPAPHAAPPAPPQLAAAPRLPRRSDLVFLQGSPNYCDPDAALGSLGTAGRACNRTSRGADGCGVMCCGRGYDTRQVTSSRQCHCKFHWCCYVHCDVCTDRYEEYTCK